MDRKSIEAEQERQEGEYQFPYHYVSRFRGNSFRHNFLDTWAINYVSTIEFLLDKIRLETARTTIDIGCGDGRFSRELALAYPTSEIVGVDYSARAIGLATAMNPDIANLKFRVADIIGDHGMSPFDNAILMEVFEHIPLRDAEDFMGAVRRLLASDGILHLTVPHLNQPLDPMHYQHFSVEKILWYLEGKFEVLDVVLFERIASSRKVLKWLLSNRVFALNNQRLLSLLYRYYKNNLFLANSEKDCQRIYVRARAI